ncbi:MAG TPA: uroporphyrinogen-III synthase [Reyranella sp.]|nr:uroporphyrinogen-III synthase [Reyranella sp.]
MRVLITRPEREAATLAAALDQRHHTAVIAPLFSLQTLPPPADFADALAACQAVLLTSANGVRALAEASEQRHKPIYAVGDTTAATAEGLGFTSVTSASGDAAALAGLVRERLDPAAGPLVHVSGADVAGEIDAPGFAVRRFALYRAREAETLPENAKSALQARALDVVLLFSPRAARVFVRLIEAAGLSEACRGLTAIAISPAAAQPVAALPFTEVIAAARPSAQAVLDEIDRRTEAGVQPEPTMSDTPPPSAPSPPVEVYRGLGVIGAFAIGVIAAAIVLAAALFSLPYWPEEARSMWRGPAPVAAAAPPPVVTKVDDSQLRAQAEALARQKAEDAAHFKTLETEMQTRLDDLDKRVRAAATTAAQADRPPASDPAIADLRAKIDALEKSPVNSEKDIAALKDEIAGLKASLQALDKSVAGEKGPIDKAVSGARASAVIGIAARVSAALETGLPFAGALGLLKPLAGGDEKLGGFVAALEPYASHGVATRSSLAARFPAVAKAALADDLADDSLTQRLLGKIKGLVSLRRVGADVQGDTTEAKLARAEAAIDAGDLAKAVEIAKTLPAQTNRATADWLKRAEAHLAAQHAVDQLAAYAVALLGAAK